MNKLLFSVLLLTLMSPSMVRGDVALAVPPFIYTGRVMDFVGQGMEVSSSVAEIRAYKEETLLATSKILNIEGVSNNFCLSIPMTASDDETIDAARVDDLLTFVIDDGVSTFTAMKDAFPRVGNPGQSVTVRLVAAKDDDGDGVADEYAEAIMDQLPSSHPAYGKTFNKNADYDGDGISNYDEYLAGTDPLTDGDSLAFETLAQASDGDLLKAEFITATGRVYGLVAAETVDGFTDVREPFKRKDDKTAPDNTTYVEDEGSDVRTIYLLKSGKSRFYKLQLL